MENSRFSLVTKKKCCNTRIPGTESDNGRRGSVVTMGVIMTRGQTSNRSLDVPLLMIIIMNKSRSLINRTRREELQKWGKWSRERWGNEKRTSLRRQSGDWGKRHIIVYAIAIYSNCSCSKNSLQYKLEGRGYRTHYSFVNILEGKKRKREFRLSALYFSYSCCR